MPSAIVVIVSSGHRLPLGERGRVGRGVLRLHADHAHVGAQRLDRGRDAGDEASASGGYDDRLDFGALLDDLEAAGALAGDDVDVVERVDQHRPGLLGELAGPRAAPRRWRCRGSGRRRRTRGWRAPWGSALPAGMNTVALMPSICAASATPCAWLPALAATTPSGLLLLGEPRHPQVGAADLERAGALQVLRLDQHRPAGDRRQPSRPLHRGVDRHPVEGLPGGPDVVEGRAAVPRLSRRTA